MAKSLAVVTTLGIAQTLAWASSYYLPGVIAGPATKDLGLSEAWMYGALSIALGVSAFIGPMIGRSIDRGHGRRILCVSNLVFGVGLVALSLCNGPISLLLAWLILGLAMALGLYEPAFAVLTVLFGQEARSAITGITLIAGFASTVGWPLSSFITSHFGWREACLAWAVVNVAIAFPLNAWAAGSTGLGPSSELKREAPSLHSAALGKQGVLLAIAFAALTVVSAGTATMLPRIFQIAGASTAAAIGAAALMGPAQVVARLIEFSAGRHRHPIVSARAATVLHPMASIIIGIFGAPSITVFALLHGAGNGLVYIAKGTLPLAIFGPNGYGGVVGRLSVASRIGQAVAPFLFGLAFDSFGELTLFVTSGLSIAALGCLAALGPTQMAKEKMAT